MKALEVAEYVDMDPRRLVEKGTFRPKTFKDLSPQFREYFDDLRWREVIGLLENENFNPMAKDRFRTVHGFPGAGSWMI